MLARPIADLVREPEQHDDEDGEEQQRRRVVRQPRLEAHDAVAATRAPAMIARPSTRSAFANSEPRIDVWATTISPAASEKRTMKSSGRLPSVDWSTPVTAGPKCVPTDSVPIPIAQARPPSATADTTKTATGSASA